MNPNQLNGTNSTRVDGAPLDVEERIEPPFNPVATSFGETTTPVVEPNQKLPTRTDKATGAGLDKNKLLLLGGGLLAAILFFAITAIVGKSHSKPAAPQTNAGLQDKTQSLMKTKGSVTPLMDVVRKPSAEDTHGQLSPEDIKRTRPTDQGMRAAQPTDNPRPISPIAGSENALSSVPAFSDTQQRWEEPRPYGASPDVTPPKVQEQQNSLKEASLVFVRNQSPNVSSSLSIPSASNDDGPTLNLTPGTRVEAKLVTEISSAVSIPVVAEVEYTYAIGDQIILPAGAKVYGQLQHADRSGNVGVKFDEIELQNGDKEKIDAIGVALDMGPIKGTVSGANTGKNFLIRAASGIGSVAAALIGNNASASFSEADLLRERVSENIGNAGDSELINLSVNSSASVSVPADRKIYIVFTKHEQTPATLHKVPSTTQQ